MKKFIAIFDHWPKRLILELQSKTMEDAQREAVMLDTIPNYGLKFEVTDGSLETWAAFKTLIIKHCVPQTVACIQEEEPFLTAAETKPYGKTNSYIRILEVAEDLQLKGRDLLLDIAAEVYKQARLQIENCELQEYHRLQAKFAKTK